MSIEIKDIPVKEGGYEFDLDKAFCNYCEFSFYTTRANTEKIGEPYCPACYEGKMIKLMTAD